MPDWLITVALTAVGVAFGVVAAWLNERRKTRGDVRTAARLLEDELMTVGLRLEWMERRYKARSKDWAAHLDGVDVANELIERTDANAWAGQSAELDEWRASQREARQTERKKLELKMAKDLLGIYLGLPRDLPESFERWAELSPALARGVSERRWLKVRRAYSAMGVLKELPRLFARDIVESTWEDVAWAHRFDDLRTQVREAVEELAKIAGDSASGWTDMTAALDDFFENATLGQPIPSDFDQ